MAVEGSGITCTAGRPPEIGKRTSGWLIAPGIGSPVRASRGFLPLGFSGQDRPGPLAVGSCLAPVHVNHREVFVLGVAVVRSPRVWDFVEEGGVHLPAFTQPAYMPLVTSVLSIQKASRSTV